MKIRVLVAKPGLDGHDRGQPKSSPAPYVTQLEVIYTGQADPGTNR